MREMGLFGAAMHAPSTGYGTQSGQRIGNCHNSTRGIESRSNPFSIVAFFRMVALHRRPCRAKWLRSPPLRWLYAYRLFKELTGFPGRRAHFLHRAPSGRSIIPRHGA
jgi:hypothetical protein